MWIFYGHFSHCASLENLTHEHVINELANSKISKDDLDLLLAGKMIISKHVVLTCGNEGKLAFEKRRRKKEGI